MVWKNFGAAMLFAFAALVGLSSPTKAALVITDATLYQQQALNFESVVWYAATNNAAGVSGRASGVVIGNGGWVLGSDHQLTHGSGVPFSSMSFGTGNALLQNGEIRNVVEVFRHPGDPGFGYDLALYRLDSPFTTIQPAELYLGNIEVGMDSWTVGYGELRQLGQNSGVFTGTAFAGNNVVSDTGYFGNFARTTLAHPVFQADIFRELGMAGTPGDSGGGLFIDGKLAASISFSSTALGLNDYGVRTGYSPVDVNWINSTMSVVPEPSSLSLLAFASLFGLVRSRRKV